MNAYDSLMLEAVPQRLPPAPRHLDGPTAQLIARERARDLWAMAHKDTHRDVHCSRTQQEGLTA